MSIFDDLCKRQLSSFLKIFGYFGDWELTAEEQEMLSLVPLHLGGNLTACPSTGPELLPDFEGHSMHNLLEFVEMRISTGQE